MALISASGGEKKGEGNSLKSPRITSLLHCVFPVEARTHGLQVSAKWELNKQKKVQHDEGAAQSFPQSPFIPI